MAVFGKTLACDELLCIGFAATLIGFTATLVGFAATLWTARGAGLAVAVALVFPGELAVMISVNGGAGKGWERGAGIGV